MNRLAMVISRSLTVVALMVLLVHAPAVEASEVALNGHRFTLPEGFEIERVAGPPLVDRPIVADFDEEGRLYVADSSGSNAPVQQQLEEKPHRIVRLEDTTGDGRFDTRTVFADRMMFPEGAMWYDGSLYVAAPPSIWKLTDTTGDGVADQREEWFQGHTLTGCANDLHGPYLGPDGWIYWTKGAFAEQSYQRPHGKPFVTRAAHIFRQRPDRSGIIEPVMTGGMDNPVELIFTREGERIFTTTFLQHPGGGRRDGLIHAIYGGVYGKVHGVIEDHPRTRPDVMPVLLHLGPAVPSGLARYESHVFGDGARDRLFATLFNLHKVIRVTLEPNGSTFTAQEDDFLVSDNRDFHPTDVLEDADGSLLVIDTGGWYKLCCPTSQLEKPDVLGAIYRVRRRDAPRVEDPRGLALAWPTLSAEALAALLDDDRPAVRWRAVATLASKGEGALPALERVLRAGATNARGLAVWALCRIDHPEARALVRRALSDAQDSVKQTALHAVSVWRDPEAVRQVRTRLLDGSLPIRRASAEALGRIGDPSVVPDLLEVVTLETADDILEHSLIYAMIEIADPVRAAQGLTHRDARALRAALIALDQMEGGGLDPEIVLPLLSSSDPSLKETAVWIAGRHPEWGDALSGSFRERLFRLSELTEDERGEFEGLLARFGRSEAIRDLLAEIASEASAATEARTTALGAMRRSGVREAPESWVLAVAKVLEDPAAELTREAVATARALALPTEGEGVEALSNGLLRVGRDPEVPETVRLDALAAVPGRLDEVGDEVFAFLNDHLESDRPVALRTTASDILAKARLDTEQRRALAERLRDLGPLEVDRLLGAFEASDEDQVGQTLVAALQESSARSSLRPEVLQPILQRYGPDVQRQAEALYQAISEDVADQHAKLEDLLTNMPEGNIRKGQDVFNSSQAACVSCHAIGYLGGDIGPDLTRIGQVRTERDLLEAILFPSASFVQSYEPVVVATTDGQVVNGVLREETAEEIVLATGPDEVVRIARDDIEEMQPSSVSIMPAGLDQQLTPQELADLLAFLKACQ